MLPFLPLCPGAGGSGSLAVGTTQCCRSQASEMKWASVGHCERGLRVQSPNSAGKLAIHLWEWGVGGEV